MTNEVPWEAFLIGGEGRFDADEGPDSRLKFLGSVFPRLADEVNHVVDVSRYLGFEGRLADGRTFEFFGIEVDTVDRVPEGLVGWTLGERSLTVTASPAASHREPVEIRWDWRKTTTGSPRPWTGEFVTVAGAPELPPRLSLTTNCYVGLKEQNPASEDVQLVGYDPSWPRRYEEFALWLRKSLGDDIALRVEHYGSTSIPGIPAKPIIDVIVEIPSFEAAKPRVLPVLNEPCWEYWWYSDHLTFIRRSRLQGERTHHVHMAPRGHPLWDGIPFRDYLRSHPDEARRYAELKRQLATSYRGDRERYTEAKTEFVRSIVAKATGG